ncbi:MAG: hypothetical protein SGILL_010073 [Bacillariaceae sp.]
MGTDSAVLHYLAIVVHELQITQCQNDLVVVNYLYYNGYFSSSQEASPRTLPWGRGITLTLDRTCRHKITDDDELKHNPFVQRQKAPRHDDKNHLDMVQFDFRSTGYIVNRYLYDEENDHGQAVAPILHNFDACDKWMKVFLGKHPELSAPSSETATQGNKMQRSEEYLQELRTSIYDSIRGVEPKSDTQIRQERLDKRPIKSSYQKAIVVEQAPWFPAQKICRDTCCAKAIAVSMEADDTHLITSVDGLDLATVGIYGHKREEYLQFAISDLNLDVIPCLQPGVIIYADHEGGGVLRFFDLYRPKMTEPFVLITAGSDGDQPLKANGQGKKLLQSDNLLYRWYGINPSYKAGANHPKFQMMNLGLGASFDQQRQLEAHVRERGYSNPFDDKSRWVNSVDLATATDTSRLLFVKFGINAHSQHR